MIEVPGCMKKDVKWIGTKVSIWEQELHANSPQDCQKLCSQSHNSSLPSDQKCCFFNWDYYSGDCNLFTDYNTAVCPQDGCHFISALWTCEVLDYSKYCPSLPGIKKLMVQNQNNRSLTRANHLSHSSKNPKFKPSKQFESIRSQRKQSKKRLAKSLCPN